MDRLLTPREVAAYLRLSDATVVRMLRRGELAGRKIGGRWRIFPHNFLENEQDGIGRNVLRATFTDKKAKSGP
jgi:excisionase family DNA binding protein